MSNLSAVTLRQCWTAVDVAPGSWRLVLPDAAVTEVVDFARDNAEMDFDATGTLALADGLEQRLPLAHEAMRETGEAVGNGVGFAVVDRLPVADLSVPESRVAAWVLFSCIGRVVDQKQSGVKIYDVRDTQPTFGHGVRRSITNLAQEFHTDAGWLDLPPEFIGLFCREPAEEGGLNQVLSLATVFEQLKAKSPESAERLSASFWWDRQMEHEPNETKVKSQPVFFEEDGELNVRYYDDYIRTGHKLGDEPIDSAGDAALANMRSIVEQKELQLEFGLEPGQYLLVNNRRVAHSRSAFSAPNDEVSRRHYFRLWSRRRGSTRLDG
jgi:hypothetical protein